MKEKSRCDCGCHEPCCKAGKAGHYDCDIFNPCKKPLRISANPVQHKKCDCGCCKICQPTQDQDREKPREFLKDYCPMCGIDHKHSFHEKDQDRETDLMKNWQKILEESDVFKNKHAKFNMILFVGQLMKDYEALLKSERRKACCEVVEAMTSKQNIFKQDHGHLTQIGFEEAISAAREYLDSI